MVEYHLDLFDKNPIEAHRRPDGQVQFTNTGDDLIDEWEQKIADGESIDLLEAFDVDGIEAMKKLGKHKGAGLPAPNQRPRTMKDNVAEANAGFAPSTAGDTFRPFGKR